MIRSYNDFLVEKELKHWEYLFDNINESTNNEDLLDRIFNYVSSAKERGEEFLSRILNKIYSFFKPRKILLILITLMLTTKLGMTESHLLKEIGHTTEHIDLIAKAKEKLKSQEKELKNFLDAIAERESSNNPSIVGKSHFGKYQFGQIVLKEIGEKELDVEKFKKDPSIWPEKTQDSDMIKLIKKNKQYLSKYIDKYNGKMIGKIKITKSGLIAAAHLLGSKNVKKFIDSNGKFNPSDGFGTKLTEYLSKFSGYDI